MNLGVENGTNRNALRTFVFDFNTQDAYLAPFVHNVQRGRLTDSDGNRLPML